MTAGCRDFSWFCFEIGCVLSQALEGGVRDDLADFFIWIAELSTKSAKAPPYACRQSKAAEAL
jgi:hypothetical protein